MRRIDRALQESGLPPLQRSAWVEVDISQLQANSTALTALGSAMLAPVVKADGYGHGMEMAGRCAISGGARRLCVADAAEALRLRSDGHTGPVFVLYPVPRAMWPAMAENRVEVTTGDREEAAAMAGGEGIAPPLRVHVEIETGMTRGGVLPDEALSTVRAIATGPRTQLAGVWTHFSTPEDARVVQEQLDRFEGVLDGIKGDGIDPGLVHAAASGGILATDIARYDLVRPGLAFYGLHPGAGGSLPPGVGPALAVKAHPVRIATVTKGTKVGYGGDWKAQVESTIATLPIGYADGWSRSSSPGSVVLVPGAEAPVVGRISSDSLTVDITGLEGVTGDTEFTLLGREGNRLMTADELAGVRGTISWEVLQQLSPRLSRVYVDGADVAAIRPEWTTRLTPAPGHEIPGY